MNSKSPLHQRAFDLCRGFVIGATAIVAIIELRHSKGSSQIAALTELKTSYEAPQFAARQFVYTELAEALGVLVKRRLVVEGKWLEADMRYEETLGKEKIGSAVKRDGP